MHLLNVHQVRLPWHISSVGASVSSFTRLKRELLNRLPYRSRPVSVTTRARVLKFAKINSFPDSKLSLGLFGDVRIAESTHDLG